MSETLTLDELKALMSELGMSAAAAKDYHALVAGNIAAASTLEALSYEIPDLPERAWTKPAATDNPLGAWYVKTQIQTSTSGRLAGKTLAIKDNVLISGVPLTMGTEVLEGYVPDEDAVIVQRILAEGGTITGKTVCEAYCFSGGSHTANTGVVRNPHKPTHSAGGSSSGSGVVVANAEVDMAIGCDQGGSIRMPASFCGIVGMKPTHSLVPYTGILGMNPAIDHAGPMTRTVADNALLLEVLAGADGEDSRQNHVPVQAYTRSLQDGIDGLRIGVLREGFGTASSEPEVDEVVRAAATRFATLGVEVREISVPAHSTAGALSLAAIQNVVTSMFDMDGFLIERPDLVPVEFIRRQRAWRQHTDSLPPNLKSVLLTAKWMQKKHGNVWAAKAKQQIRALRAAYDQALSDLDALLLPTTPMKATPLPGADASVVEQVGAALGPLLNTSPFNNTHHPAISLPCGLVDDLPIGLMLVGGHFEETVLYRLAYAFEQSRT